MTNPTVAAALLGLRHSHAPALREMLASPVRNRYFYGKLLDEMHLEMEQHYFNDKRWLLNRHGFGAGIMCGLWVEVTRDQEHVTIDPGVALDAMGREIIVPQRTAPFDPRQLTDDCGKPVGKPLRGAVTVVVGIGFHECESEPTPSLACECDDDGCEYGAVRERYAVIVQRGEKPDGKRICDKLFTPAGRADRGDVWDARMLRIGRWVRECGPDTQCPWVPLALLTVEADGTITKVDPSVRVPIVSNVVLLNLILCLAAELDVCCGGRTPPRTETLTLTALTPLNQVMAAGQLAPIAPAVRVDRNGVPAALETVVWTVGSSGGAISDVGPEQASVTMKTDNNGVATLSKWRAPTAAGAAEVTAAVAGATPPSVLFKAKVEPVVVVATPPRVIAVWPFNGAVLAPSIRAREFQEWRKLPFLDVTFDQPMTQADLEVDPTLLKAWLRTVLVQNTLGGAAHGGGPAVTGAEFVPIVPRFLEPRPSAIGTPGGVTYRFSLQRLPMTNIPPIQQRAVIVLMNAQGNNITAQSDGELLDADFDAKILRAMADPGMPMMPFFDALWNPSTIAPANRSPMAITTLKLISGDVNPVKLVQSGQGTPGGRFHSYFTIRVD